jgi:iron-sulfur cluster assembly protein
MMADLVISDAARAKLLSYDVSEGKFLRLGVTTGGCSGMTYTADFDTAFNEDDEEIFNDGEIRVVADNRSSLFLEGLVVDYSNDLIQSGFRLGNPNAKNACGCGSSFQV